MKKNPYVTIIILIAFIILLIFKNYQTNQKLKEQTITLNELQQKNAQLEEEKRLKNELEVLNKALYEQTIDSLQTELNKK